MVIIAFALRRRSRREDIGNGVILGTPAWALHWLGAKALKDEL